MHRFLGMLCVWLKAARTNNNENYNMEWIWIKLLLLINVGD